MTPGLLEDGDEPIGQDEASTLLSQIVEGLQQAARGEFVDEGILDVLDESD